MASPTYTRHFDLPIPHAGDVNFGQTLQDWFSQAEVTLGCNTNLILTANTIEGAGTRNHLGVISNFDEVTDVPVDDWGRVILQKTMVNGVEVLCRLVGITDVLGLESTAQYGDTIYHHSSLPSVTIAPENAIRVGDDRLEFLPLGFSFSAGRRVMFNGLLPIQFCPTVVCGRPVAYSDGSSNPSTSWVEAYESNTLVLTATFDGAAQDLDLIVPAGLPGDFLSFPDLNSADYWGFKASYKTTGTGTLKVYSVIDSDGTEFVLSTTGEASGTYADLLVRWAVLAALDATWTPNTTIYFRLKAEGGAADTVKVKTWSQVQYFPSVEWL